MTIRLKKVSCVYDVLCNVESRFSSGATAQSRDAPGTAMAELSELPLAVEHFWTEFPSVPTARSWLSSRARRMHCVCSR